MSYDSLHAKPSRTPAWQPRWYLIHCKPRQEQRALEHLERQGFECYEPWRPVERRRGTSLHKSLEPLFPGYLFIRLDRVHDNWLPIRSTRGVNRVVSFNAFPLPVADEIVDGIRTRIGEPQMKPYFSGGDRVRVTEGSFAQLEAIFIAHDGDERVILLLNMLQTEQSLSFPVSSVRKLG